jgi:hypothetical protein
MSVKLFVYSLRPRLNRRALGGMLRAGRLLANCNGPLLLSRMQDHQRDSNDEHSRHCTQQRPQSEMLPR